MDISRFVAEGTQFDRKAAVERKKVKDWLKSVCAYANTEGGDLLFGVDDNNNDVGLKNIQDDSEFISDKITERIRPLPQFIMTSCKTENGKDLLVVHTLKGYDPPYFYFADGRMEAYVRAGNNSIVADDITLRRLVLQGNNLSYDAQMSAYRYKDYSFSKLRERYNSWMGKSMTDNNMVSFGICDANGFLTNAGALLADDCPIRCSRLFCTRWDGNDRSGGRMEALDDGEYSGSLLILLNEGLSFIKRNMKKMWKKTGTSRIEYPEYCERSFLESLVNALVHRDYLIYGSEVHIDMYDNRMTITSPGGMPDGTSVQDRDISDIASTRRNPVLADIFSRLGYMERRGSGLNKIREAYLNAANYRPELAPEFKSTQSTFMVTLWNLNYSALEPESTYEQSEANSTDSLSKDERSALDAIRRYPNITQEDLAKLLQISRTKVQMLVKRLKDGNYIARNGARKNGTWVILDK
ncbi:MAG: putative DNA binding domain-containing protein [Clostridia bacterium]|nr:putative DNA binding domain-containing protein [Clostridia bacterium]